MKANQNAKNLKEDTSGYTKIVGGLVALLLTIIIGVLVFWEVNDSITLSSDDANDSRNETTDTASTVFGLLPLVALVVVASIILAVVMGFGGGKGGM
jgi:hypothetical protein